MPKAFRRFAAMLRAPTIVYLGSGRPFLRDVVLLCRRGYELQSIVPFDSQPHSPRLELMARLEYCGAAR